MNAEQGEDVARSDRIVHVGVIRRTRPTVGLAIASSSLAVSNLLLIAAAVFSAGGWHIGTFDMGKLASLAMAVDTVAVALFAASLWALADRTRDRTRRWLRRSAIVFASWVVLSVTWRFLLPMTAGTDAETIFYDIFTPEDVLPRTVSPSFTNGMLALWTVAAALFVIGSLAILVARLNARADDPVRKLPAFTWLVAAALSFVGTLLVVFALASQLEDARLSSAFLPGAFLKIVAAPYLFLYGYGRGAQWGWEQLHEARAPVRTEA